MLLSSLGFSCLVSQTYSANISIDSVYISDLEPGDEIRIPIRFISSSGGLIIGFQFFIEFDHSLFSWNGTNAAPLTGVKNINEKMPFSQNNWLFNDNGNQMVALWDDPNFNGINMHYGDIFFEYVFTYKGGLKIGMTSALTWGSTFELLEGNLIRGTTELYSEQLDLYNLTKEDGVIINIDNN